MGLQRFSYDCQTANRFLDLLIGKSFLDLPFLFNTGKPIINRVGIYQIIPDYFSRKFSSL